MRGEAVMRDEHISRPVHKSDAIVLSNFAMSNMPKALEVVLPDGHCNHPIQVQRQTHSDNEGGVDCSWKSRWMNQGLAGLTVYR